MAIFEGSGVAIVTPFKDTENQEINYEVLEELIEFQIANGTDSIIIAGTTGEASTLTDEEQLDLIREQYLGDHPVKHQFCVSTQHYSFAVNAFVDLIKEYDADQYSFIIRETQTGEIIEDVASGKSEIGFFIFRNTMKM